MVDTINTTWPAASRGTLTLPGPTAPSKPYAQNKVVIQVKNKWADTWATDMSLIPIRGEAHIRRAGESEFHFKRNYGPAEKQPYETAYSAVTPVDFINWWVRVLLVGNDLKTPGAQNAQDQGEILFQGLIEDQTLNIGADDNGRMGVQGFKAVGPEMILRKIEIHQSRWLAADGFSYFTADWMPGFNIRSVHADEADDYVALEGNMTDLMHTDQNSFVFGGTDGWSNHDMLNYILTFFVNQRDGDGAPLATAPIWTIGGQADALEVLSTRIPMPASISADEAIQKIIPSAVGVEYKITPTTAGFEITLFSTTPEDGTFGGFTMPKNPDVWTADVGSDPLIAKYAVVVNSAKRKYDKIKIIGERVRMCFSYGSGQLIPTRILWTAALQSEFEDGAQSSDWDLNDRTRADERFRGVFRDFGPDPTILSEKYSLSIQTNQRRTLAELPILAGLDYSVSPPTDGNATDTKPSFLRPLVFVSADVIGKAVQLDRLKDVDEYYDAPNISAQALKDEWGVHLNCTPNQFLGRNNFTVAYPTGYDPAYETSLDYTSLIFTIAIETDLRLSMVQALPTALQTGTGSTKILHAPDAHYWVMTPGTVIGVDEAGALKLAHLDNLILRDDTDRLARSMAGAVAAYMNSIVNMVVEYKNLMPLNSKLGSIMRSVEDGGTDTNLWSMVSSVTWNFETNETELSTGYALASA